MSDFKPVETYSNWCYIDKLDGQTIIDGEWVDVLWPDDTVTMQQVMMQRGSFEYDDMGHKCRGSDHKAYLNVSVRSVTAKVYLRGMDKIKLRRTSP